MKITAVKRFVTAIICCSLFVVSANAQKDLVRSGTVKDGNGPLEGVSVALKDKAQGTVTDSLGRFSLVARNGDRLVISAVGLISQEIEVTASTVYNIVLSARPNTMNEVVVIGYGTQSKRNITGAISKISLSQTEDLPNTNVTQSLRGRVAGVQFTDNGRPGQNGSILIRGTKSLSASNNPLIILDGIFFNGSFIDINPNDIESLEVLKDASASAIYGSRAANGVILITSKKGKTEKPNIRISSFYGTSEWASRLKLLSPERYIQKSIDIRKAQGAVVDPDDPATFLTLTEVENYKKGITIDPYDMISQDARIYSTDVSISGKSARTNYYLSGSFSNENGLVYQDNIKRRSFRINLENKLADWLTIGTNSMYSENDQSGVPADITKVRRQSPFGTWFYPDGTPTQNTVPEDQGASPNPLYGSYFNKNENVRSNLFASFYSIIQIPKIKGLSYRVNFSNNYRWIRDYNLTQQDKNLTTNTTSASKRNWRAADWVLENILDYSKKFGDNTIDATLMYGSNKFTTESTTATATQLASDVLGWNGLQTGAILTNVSSAEQTSGVSSMARINYRYKNRYLLTFTARRDGSSVFAENYKYATLPSAAFSWIASDESFIKKINAINLLKLRISYGAVGNQAISPYQSLSLANTNYYVFGDGAGSSLGIYPSNISNENLKWETTYMTNIGLDFLLLNSRIGGTIELYDMSTRDLLVERSLPIMTGYTSVWTNLGEVNNRGIELTLNTVNLRTKQFEWRTDFVFSTNRNKIVHLYGSDVDGDGKEDDDLGNRWFIGRPVNVFYDYVFDGIYQKGDVLPSGYQPGFAKFRDLNGDGKVEAANDRTIVGQAEPKYRWGLTNTFSYKGFQFSAFINAMSGWLGVFNELDYYFDNIGPIRPSNMLDSDWWTEEHPSTTRPSLEYNRSTLGHNWYRSRNFIRIQDVSLSYNFSSRFLDRYKLSNLAVYVSGKNLGTFTDWLGTNPETITSYPIARSIATGFRLGF